MVSEKADLLLIQLFLTLMNIDLSKHIVSNTKFIQSSAQIESIFRSWTGFFMRTRLVIDNCHT